MNYSVRRVLSREWAELEGKAHLVVFGERLRDKLDRIDFALLLFGDSELGGYVTCKEMDRETLYFQHGGVFPNFQKTRHVLHGYAEALRWALTRYARITTRIENTNTVMLKLALRMGFLIDGVVNFKGRIYLTLTLEG